MHIDQPTRVCVALCIWETFFSTSHDQFLRYSLKFKHSFSHSNFLSYSPRSLVILGYTYHILCNPKKYRGHGCIDQSTVYGDGKNFRERNGWKIWIKKHTYRYTYETRALINSIMKIIIFMMHTYWT